MRAVGRALAVLAVAALGVPALAGCSAPPYQYVGNDDHDLVLRVPKTWSKINSDAVLRASGEDPSTAVGWLAFFDASPKPSVKHASDVYADDPVMIARSVDVPADQRASVTGDALRDLLIPVTESARTEQQISAMAAGQSAPDFKLLADKTLTGRHERGVHVMFSYGTGGHTEVYDKVAVTDPKKTKVHLVLVHCSQTCFDTRGKEIDAVVSSLTVKK